MLNVSMQTQFVVESTCNEATQEGFRDSIIVLKPCNSTIPQNGISTALHDCLG